MKSGLWNIIKICWIYRHDDIHKINDETYNIISITTYQKNGLRTNISIDIHCHEKNNNNMVSTTVICDDQVENFVQFWMI
ncbi:erythrocyte membrane protein 1-like, putative [Plasmodium reichenowi]|uniref:Erythrocyte membrane protein 1-like, putative n=1 Tax=Plasmodium reichenowi TaxID=5854 RepID=A0A2P9DTJ4_PLARE|nr:erythrocyte membrane protein 1-like, putative [Plasmodium reichenowi]